MAAARGHAPELDGEGAPLLVRLTEKLMMDGMIYSTIDDEHFRST